jgi:hypothetical protein
MKRMPTVALVLVALLGLGGCSSGASTSSDSGGGRAPVAEAPAEVSDGGAVADEEGAVAEDGRGDEGAALDDSRSLITTGTTTISVDDPAGAADAATDAVQSLGGRVESRSQTAGDSAGDGASDGSPRDETPEVGASGGYATVTVRIPAATLTAALDSISALGEVESMELGTEDVTRDVQDLDARITAAQTSVDRLLTLLKSSGSTRDLIDVESALADRQAELESMQAQKRYLDDQVAMSTITVRFISVEDAPVDNPDTFFSGLESGWNGFVTALSATLVLLGVLLPWIVFLGLVAVAVLLVVRASRRRRHAATTPGGSSGERP